MKNREDIYCNNCGSDELAFIRNTASGRTGYTISHFKCKECGDEHSFELPKEG